MKDKGREYCFECSFNFCPPLRKPEVVRIYFAPRWLMPVWAAKMWVPMSAHKALDALQTRGEDPEESDWCGQCGNL